jgi:hypothetical protein
MAEITISEGWDKIRTKIKRKYSHLTDAMLPFSPGQEEELIRNLMNLVHRDRKYVVFMLTKFQHTMDSNRL